MRWPPTSKTMKKWVMVEPGEDAKSGQEKFNYNLEFQESQKDFVRQKYQKMKERAARQSFGSLYRKAL